MHKITSCRDGCVYAQCKKKVWLMLARHRDGCGINKLIDETGLCFDVVKTILEDLYVTDNVDFCEKTGRWYPETSPFH